jgi:hypothetical protein
MAHWCRFATHNHSSAANCAVVVVKRDLSLTSNNANARVKTIVLDNFNQSVSVLYCACVRCDVSKNAVCAI